MESIKLSNKMTMSLKSTLDALDLIPEYEEINNNEANINNIDIIKERTRDLIESREQNILKNKSLEEINKFNLSIIRNAGWGNYIGSTNKSTDVFRHFVKPNKRELEKEMGKYIVNTKLPRSRVFNLTRNYKN
jgi:hypothetical protein